MGDSATGMARDAVVQTPRGAKTSDRFLAVTVTLPIEHD